MESREWIRAISWVFIQQKTVFIFINFPKTGPSFFSARG